MTSATRSRLSAAVLLVAGLMLSGCGFFHRAAERKNNEYLGATQSRPLEIPPGLDMPGSSGALIVPDASRAPSTAAMQTTPPAMASSSPMQAAPGRAGTSAAANATSATSGVVLSGAGLHVADTPESTYSRVGLALERSGAARIVDRDDAAMRYSVETTGRTTRKAGWFKRAVTFGRAKESVAAQVRLDVRVEADGDRSKVVVEGAGDEASRDAANALMQALHERLS